MTKELQLSQGKVAIVDDGDFEWLSQWKWFFAKSYKGLGYAVRTTSRDSGFIYLHRFILDAPADMQVDHINGDRLDNRRENLRLCTQRQNCRNQNGRSGTSQYKGVTWHRQRSQWQATISTDEGRLYLGIFHDEIDAAKAYDEAARKYHGEFAKTNF